MKRLYLFIFIISFLTYGFSQTKDAEYYTKLGRSYCSDFNYSEGMKCYAKAIEIDPNYFDAYVDRGLWRMALRDYDGAINDFKKAVSLDTLSRLAIHNLGAVYQMSGELDSALFCFNKSISIDSINTGSYHSRGDVFFAFGNLDLAIADYSKQIQFDPRDELARTYYMRGIARLEIGDSTSGKLDLKEAFEIESLNKNEMRMRVNHLRSYRKK
jgi:tetratricopeptide (TPR) repeat protein